MNHSLRSNPKPEELKELSQFEPLVQKLLAWRGITSAKDAEVFLKPDFERDTHDALKLPDIEVALERIMQALKNNEKIAIYADYDADGVPGAAILTEALQAVGVAEPRVYIPHRGREGFGLNEEAVHVLAAEGVKLIITVDCGITDLAEAALARELGVDLIVTDHHTPIEAEGKEVLPEAVAVINPKRADSSYPFRELAGSGVVYKLATALLERARTEGLNESAPGWERWWLDLAGLATVADMVPLLDENRSLAEAGIRVLRMGRRPGLRELARSARRKTPYLTEDDIAFALAPRINAASRMGDAILAYQLLVSKNASEAAARAEALEHLNKSRRGLVAAAIKEARGQIATQMDDAVLTVGDSHWRPGILGLIAGKLAEEYNKPVFVWGREAPEYPIKGSCRSAGTLDVVTLMRALPDEMFTNRGGHEQAGGFSLAPGAVHDLHAALNQHASEAPSASEAELIIDAALSPDELTGSLVAGINQLAPFGMGNERPVLRLLGRAPLSVRALGRSGNFSEATLETKHEPVRIISFRHSPANFEQALKNDQGEIDCLITLERDQRSGRVSVQLK